MTEHCGQMTDSFMRPVVSFRPTASGLPPAILLPRFSSPLPQHLTPPKGDNTAHRIFKSLATDDATKPVPRWRDDLVDGALRTEDGMFLAAGSYDPENGPPPSINGDPAHRMGSFQPVQWLGRARADASRREFGNVHFFYCYLP